MSFTVNIQPSGHSFTVEENELILDAALKAGISFPYGCRGGGCWACRGTIIEGEVDYGDFTPRFSEEDIANKSALFCVSTATTDLTIEMKEISAIKEIEIKNLPTRVQEMEKLSDDVMKVKLLIPPTERLQFLSGQYIEIIMEDGRRRAFSIANAPFDDKCLELHIKYIPGGDFTEYVFNKMKVRDLLRFEGPHGTFTLREESMRPIIMLATGTGFAPIKSILEHAFAEGVTRPIYFYWGGRNKHDFYMDEQLKAWAEQHANLRYIPVVSQPDDAWQGRTGHVQTAVLEDFASLAGYEVYACGNPAMVKEGFDLLTKQGVKSENYMSDAFTFSNK